MDSQTNNIFDQYAELVRRYKTGDESAFTEIYTRSKQMVYVTCFGILNNEQDAEDAMQETYITAYSKIDTLSDENAFIHWLKTIAANKARDKLKTFLQSTISYLMKLISKVMIILRIFLMHLFSKKTKETLSIE